MHTHIRGGEGVAVTSMCERKTRQVTLRVYYYSIDGVTCSLFLNYFRLIAVKQNLSISTLDVAQKYSSITCLFSVLYTITHLSWVFGCATPGSVFNLVFIPSTRVSMFHAAPNPIDYWERERAWERVFMSRLRTFPTHRLSYGLISNRSQQVLWGSPRHSMYIFTSQCDSASDFVFSLAASLHGKRENERVNESWFTA